MSVVVMGVTGSGKTSVGEQLAQQLGWTFADADDYHSPEAKARMARGEGLTDADRAPWLARLHDLLAADDQLVLACSALKRAYREALGVPGLHFVYLRVPRPLLEQHLAGRHGHYATASLLPSQLAALEEPTPDEAALTLDVGEADTPASLAGQARRWLEEA